MMLFGFLWSCLVICDAIAVFVDRDRSLEKPLTVSQPVLHDSKITTFLATDQEDTVPEEVSLLQGSLHRLSVSHDSEQTSLRTDRQPIDLKHKLDYWASYMRQVKIPNASAGLDRMRSFADNFARSLDPFPNAHEQQTPAEKPHYAQEGSDIWNETHFWVNFTYWHPKGMVSNVNGGEVRWANVGFMSLARLCGLTILAYPAVALVVIFLLVIIVSISISVEHGDGTSDRDPCGPPMISPSRLSPASQRIYMAWRIFCCTLPALIVFGTPMLLMYYSYTYPQEVFVVTLVICLAFAFNHALYMVFFVPFVDEKFKLEALEASENIRSDDDPSHSEGQVYHWVFFPNYKEEVEVLSMAIQSVAQSTIARSRIGIVLAMEEREQGASEKAMKLQSAFKGKFRDIQMFLHPKNLPNDPPGKASNMSFAFKSLVQYLEITDQAKSGVMITVADADSDFHERYFEALTCKYRRAEDPDTTIWQSPVYHFKNYHRQPGPCVIGSLITAMTETACLADPNAIRYPYSTYSLPLGLVMQVGGWDPEWIAEDWHMGIKCFLMTLGRSCVKPIFLPTLNYSPEEDTWWGTMSARWAQAKRHALGFSDLSYFFMTLPLIFVHIVSSSKSPGLGLQGFWRLIFLGSTRVVKLVNTHALVGIMTLYMILDLALKKVMMLALGELRGVEELFDRTLYGAQMFAMASTVMTLIVTFNFQGMYKRLVHRFDEPSSSWVWLFKYRYLHWLFNVLCFACCGLMVFPSLAACVWVAAIKCSVMWRSGGFEYEVAAKPTKKNRT